MPAFDIMMKNEAFVKGNPPSQPSGQPAADTLVDSQSKSQAEPTAPIAKQRSLVPASMKRPMASDVPSVVAPTTQPASETMPTLAEEQAIVPAETYGDTVANETDVTTETTPVVEPAVVEPVAVEPAVEPVADGNNTAVLTPEATVMTEDKSPEQPSVLESEVSNMPPAPVSATPVLEQASPTQVVPQQVLPSGVAPAVAPVEPTVPATSVPSASTSSPTSGEAQAVAEPANKPIVAEAKPSTMSWMMNMILRFSGSK
jgi:hypothetical protein